MAKKSVVKKKQKPPVDFGGYLLVNHEKVDRVVNGTVSRGGQLVGGVGKDAPAAAVLAEYDRIGGLILDANGEKLATGSFYDFEAGAPRVKAKPSAKPKPTAKKGIKEERVGEAWNKKGKKRTPADEDEEEGEEEEESEESEEE